MKRCFISHHSPRSFLVLIFASRASSSKEPDFYICGRQVLAPGFITPIGKRDVQAGRAPLSSCCVKADVRRASCGPASRRASVYEGWIRIIGWGLIAWTCIAPLPLCLGLAVMSDLRLPSIRELFPDHIPPAPTPQRAVAAPASSRNNPAYPRPPPPDQQLGCSFNILRSNPAALSLEHVASASVRNPASATTMANSELYDSGSARASDERPNRPSTHLQTGQRRQHRQFSLPGTRSFSSVEHNAALIDSGAGKKERGSGRDRSQSGTASSPFTYVPRPSHQGRRTDLELRNGGLRNSRAPKPSAPTDITAHDIAVAAPIPGAQLPYRGPGIRQHDHHSTFGAHRTGAGAELSSVTGSQLTGRPDTAFTHPSNSTTDFYTLRTSPASPVSDPDAAPFSDPDADLDDEEQGNGKTLVDRRHTCQLCHKKFNRPSSLQIHLNTHTGNKPFICPYPDCGRLFNVNSNMRRHFRGHPRVMVPGSFSDAQSPMGVGEEGALPPMQRLHRMANQAFDREVEEGASHSRGHASMSYRTVVRSKTGVRHYKYSRYPQVEGGRDALDYRNLEDDAVEYGGRERLECDHMAALDLDDN